MTNDHPRRRTKRLYRVTTQTGRVFHYQTLQAAEHRKDVLASADVPATIEPSNPITWPEPTPILDPSEPCGRGPCAAPEGHPGTCSEASGWEPGA